MTDSTCLQPGEMGRTPPNPVSSSPRRTSGMITVGAECAMCGQYTVVMDTKDGVKFCTACQPKGNCIPPPAAESVNIDTDGGEEPPIIDCAGAYITRDGTHAEVEFGGDGHWHGTLCGKKFCWNPDGTVYGGMSGDSREIVRKCDFQLLTAAQIEEIERRVKEYDKDPSKGIPWDVVKDKILHKLYGGGVVNEPPVKKAVPPTQSFKIGDVVKVLGNLKGTVMMVSELYGDKEVLYKVGFPDGAEAWYSANNLWLCGGAPLNKTVPPITCDQWLKTYDKNRKEEEDEGGDDVVEQGELDGTSRLVIDLPEDLINALDNIAGEAGLSSNTVVVGILINYILNRRLD